MSSHAPRRGRLVPALVLALTLAVLLGRPVAPLDAQDGEVKLGTVITALPFTISAPGVYVLNTELPATALASGAAITVAADNVTVELNGHALANTQANNTAVAIAAADRRNVTVRNGAIRGFFAGVDLASSLTDGSLSGGHLVEEVAVRDAAGYGISVWGNDNVVRRCQVNNAGGSSLTPGGEGYGIIVQAGRGARVLDNDVAGVKAGAAGRASFGVMVLKVSDALVVGNRLSGPADYGLYFEADASGKYRNNLVGAGVGRGFFGPGADAGKNIVDSDGDGLDDDWERRLFGNLTTANATSDSDGDGVSDLDEYRQGSDPRDFYNGRTPVLTIVDGNNQTGAPNGFVTRPLVLQVTNAAGQILRNAPVSFAVGQGGGQVQKSSLSAPATSLTILTDSNGQARVFFKLPPVANSTSQIPATTGTGAQTARVSFTESSDGGGGPPGGYPSPFAPRNLVSTANRDGSVDVTWENSTDDSGDIQISFKQADGSWLVLATVPAGTTSVHIPAP